MRKGIVIAGAVVLVISIAAIGGGLFFAVGQSGLASLGVSAPKTTVTLAPGADVTVGNTTVGEVTVVTYSDNASAPIQVSSGGSSPVTKTTDHNGVTYYYLVFTPLQGTDAVVMHNNNTATLSVQYAAVQSSLGALAVGGLLILGGGVAFIVGLVLLIVGAAMKKKGPPGQP